MNDNKILLEKVLSNFQKDLDTFFKNKILLQKTREILGANSHIHQVLDF